MIESFHFNSFAKLNLSLIVQGIRKDFHMLRMINTEIDLPDKIRGEFDLDVKKGKVIVETIPDLRIPMARNTVYKALMAYFNLIEFTPNFKITIKKSIPTGTGLGGGSSNAAYTLLFLHKLFPVLTDEKLVELGATIGSDVPFFIHGAGAQVLGRGNVVKPLKLSLKKYHFVIVIPKFRLLTPNVYAEFDRLKLPFDTNIDEKIHLFPLRNDLYVPAQNLQPLLEKVIKDIRRTNPIDCSMTGSGSACFGIYDNLLSAQKASQILRTHYSKVIVAHAKETKNI
jgi:4-diphosphocytidyl-2-C-methyl-D-erythritol kinase